MANFFENLGNSAIHFSIMDVVDILLVAGITYGLLRLTSKTRASQVFKGLALFIVLAWICKAIGLSTVNWLLSSFIDAGALLLVVIFQPEIRRAFEKLGRGGLFEMSFSTEEDASRPHIEEIERAVLNMSIRKIGALMVFERKTGMKDVIESGNLLNARISSQLIENIFFPNSPMHDGAMILRGDKIVAAGCFLPLSDNKQISSELGTRHRAALGISELSDAYILIVSEETGVISLAHEGTITRYLDRKALHTVLEKIYEKGPARSKLLRRKGEKKQ